MRTGLGRKIGKRGRVSVGRGGVRVGYGKRTNRSGVGISFATREGFRSTGATSRNMGAKANANVNGVKLNWTTWKWIFTGKGECPVKNVEK